MVLEILFERISNKDLVQILTIFNRILTFYFNILIKKFALSTSMVANPGRSYHNR
ncbi:UNVERIFIED_CONTAM: hypothetical protein QE387_000622 [Pseudacidovorax intermedius]|nr:hypothetical protein [Chryseobacterium sp. SORGH_AS_1048]MDT3406305.1 hypothetical protein [Pseudacidovorax intermedius]